MIYDANRFVHAAAVSAVCLLVSGCNFSDVHRDTRSIEQRARKATAKENNNGEIPGADVLPLMDNVKMSETIKRYVQQGHDTISINNNLDGMYDLKDALEPLNTPEAIKTVRSLGLYNFPFDDDMLEPIKSLDLNFLAIQGGRLSNLHSLKNLHSLVALSLQRNPINAEGIRVLAHMPSLTNIDLSYDAVTEDDMKLILTNPRIKNVTVRACPYIRDAEIKRLRRLRPDVVFRYGLPERPGESFAKSIMNE